MARVDGAPVDAHAPGKFTGEGVGELQRHFRRMNAYMATLAYEDAIHVCATCGRYGENVTGKKESPAGRSKFCSDECRAAWLSYHRAAERDLGGQDLGDGAGGSDAEPGGGSDGESDG